MFLSKLTVIFNAGCWPFLKRWRANSSDCDAIRKPFPGSKVLTGSGHRLGNRLIEHGDVSAELAG
ncbi:hypothetical protein SH668x_002174 [Planctomicrobium sp. SH668]|uniref:hypothetical protein n=1 Tax=Planctomicrobium sp. SH668 TaxID=3448126 RepID=UPI003F5B1DE1